MEDIEVTSMDSLDEESTSLLFFDDLTSNYMSLPQANNATLTRADYDNVDCMEMPRESQAWSIVCEGILSVMVGVCGLLGNAATMMVLSRPIFKETFHKLLICLSCFDSIFIGKPKYFAKAADNYR